MNMTSDKAKDTLSGPGLGTLVCLGGLLLAGALFLGLWMPDSGSWQAGALGGWLVAGVMGMLGLWSTRKAFRSEPGDLLKIVFGFMFLRLIFAGLAAGLVIGFGWLDASGFIIGLFAGVVLFQAVEIGALGSLAKKKAPVAENS